MEDNAMYKDEYIGCDCPFETIQAMSERLSEKVLEKIYDTQNLVTLNQYARETNESNFKESVRDRIADISSWRWVLEDLSKRLEEAINGLKYEHKACLVVGRRIENEIKENEKLKPGILCPKKDNLEKALKSEQKYLAEQKKIFKELPMILEHQMDSLRDLIDRIKNDVLNKDHTVALEETMSNINLNNLNVLKIKPKRKNKPSSVLSWENRCRALKDEGLYALADALYSRQQARGSRIHLTVAAQAAANKVDVALRRRLHANRVKLEELQWQKEEAEKDLKSLEAEKLNSEQSILSTMEQVRVIEARLADRSYRPAPELTKDAVDRKLKAELKINKKFLEDLRYNLNEIACLQNRVIRAVDKINCFMADLQEIVTIDEERMLHRLGDLGASEISQLLYSQNENNQFRQSSPIQTTHNEIISESLGQSGQFRKGSSIKTNNSQMLLTSQSQNSQFRQNSQTNQNKMIRTSQSHTSQFERNIQIEDQSSQNIQNSTNKSGQISSSIVTVASSQIHQNYRILESIREEDESILEDEEDDYPFPSDEEEEIDDYPIPY